MSKTAIQLVNLVGVNLRRSTGSTYTTLTQDANASFITAAVNEAKRMVEDAWKWDSLRTTIVFDTVAGTRSYDLSSGAIATPVTTDRAMVLRDQGGRLQAWDVEDSGAAFRLQETTIEEARNTALVAAQSLAKPSLVNIYPNGSGLTVYFPYAPEAARTINVDVCNPQDDFTTEATVLLVPFRPVVLAATAIACEERGEELGMQATRWWDQYENALSTALGRDMSEEDTILVPV